MPNSHLTNQPIPAGEEVAASDIRTGVFELIASQFPGFNHQSYLSLAELNQFRRQYLSTLMATEKGELAELDKEVMLAISNNSFLSENIEEHYEEKITFGQRVADKVASFGGSWTFIISFFVFILVWMAINIWLLQARPFDPYPFILLNLILSCVASIQAPIIMMSQNRQEQKDRIRAEHDYKINLKAELEIKLLSEKMDHLLVHQNKKLMEIQEVQIDYLEDLLKALKQK